MFREKKKDGTTLITGKVIATPATPISLLDVYPVGSIYISVVSTNPGTLFGGTWSAFATGRTLVGIDAGQTEFDTVMETGGAKTHTLTVDEMPAHRHTLNVRTSSTAGSANPMAGSVSGAAGTQATSIDNTGGGAAHNNLQPYIVTYMWRRTA